VAWVKHLHRNTGVETARNVRPPKIQRQSAVEQTTHNVSPAIDETSSTVLWSDMVDQKKKEKEQEENKASKISKGIRELMFMGA
jgi:hypothetical protein